MLTFSVLSYLSFLRKGVLVFILGIPNCDVSRSSDAKKKANVTELAALGYVMGPGITYKRLSLQFQMEICPNNAVDLPVTLTF